MGAIHSTSRNTARLALVTSPPPATPGAPTGVPAGLRLVRLLDRSVLEIARVVDLRPMELYALLILSDAPPGEAVTTRALSERLAASTSQTKQIALRLATRGYVQRGGARGSTRLTPEGQALAHRAALLLEDEMLERLGRDDPVAVARGAAKLQALAASPSW
jgi:DNA-binding MarR family transcriptional regulator